MDCRGNARPVIAESSSDRASSVGEEEEGDGASDVNTSVRLPRTHSLDLESHVMDVAGVGEIIVAASCRYGHDEEWRITITLTLHSMMPREARWREMVDWPID